VAWQEVFYTMLPFILAVAILTTLALYVLLRFRHVPGGGVATLILLVMAEWALMDALELASVSLSAKLLWNQLKSVGIFMLAPLWLIYVLQYTRREKWLTRRTLALLSIVPLIAILLVFTNESHGLMWSRAVLKTDDVFSLLEITYGVGVFAYAGYSCILTLFVLFLLVQMRIHSRRFYRRQVNALLLATCLPWLAFTLYVLDWKPHPQFYPVPLVLIADALAGVWNIVFGRIGDIMPVAREVIVEGISDSVFVLDLQNRVVDLNPAAQRLVGRAASEAIGQPVEQIWQEWPTLVEHCPEGAGESEEVVLSWEDGQHTYDVHISPLVDRRGQLISRVVVLHDISELKAAHELLRIAHDELELRVQERTGELAKANEALQAEIAERKRAEEQIKASLREKEVLLKEIHHRVKNNLQVISSLLYLQSKNVKDKGTFGILQESQSRVRSMVLVHERLYQSPDLARIDFAEYIRSLANYLFRSYGVNTNVIQLRLNVDDVLLGVDTAIPCGLILNELVSNALKHAFPDGREGEVRIELRADDGQLTLIVSDNGVGLPQDLDFRDTESLGLQLVNTLVEQIEGTIELDRSDGTAFKITFTEPGYEGGG
jgi:PAS domain S-box-containing protein